MPKSASAQNNFTRGLITEATGLNFPENACTSTENCVFTLIGDVARRPGIDYESGFALNNQSTSGAVSSFRWLNAGGDGETQVIVVQTGDTLNFYQSTNSTVADPISTTLLASTVNLTAFTAVGQSGDPGTIECQYASGNGYLFVYNAYCDPFYCTFNAGVISASIINLQIRDFNGYYPEPGNPPINFRPSSLSIEHQYNLENQGWTGTPSWGAVVSSTNAGYFTFTSGGYTIQMAVGNSTFTVASSISGISPGQLVNIIWVAEISQQNGVNSSVAYPNGIVEGSVVSYSGTSLVINVLTSTVYSVGPPATINFLYAGKFTITPGVGNNTIATFQSDVSVYPSNADIWYTFKDGSGIFDPTTTYANVSTPSTPAPRGYFILNAFNQKQTTVSNIAGLTNLQTGARPSTGAWFQGRVWYAGVNGSQAATGDQSFYTWSESIYFSQIILANDITSFGYCYQVNDPTDENLFDLLPTDGGQINIQGCGNIYKLFPIQNGMLVFAQNGVWFITGSTGIGFAATDYTVTKISAVQSSSNTSYVDVLGLPFFWNEEGIYRVMAAQNGGSLVVEPLTVGTILSFYNDIPLDSKLYARGGYDPINYIVRWVYRTTQESGIANRYQFDGILNFNVYNKAFYPSSLNYGSSPTIASIQYVNFTNSITAPDPGFRYITVDSSGNYTFAADTDTTNWVDWYTALGSSGIAYDSFFTTGYALHGHGIGKWQPIYLNIYSRNEVPTQYLIQGTWDYATSTSTGRYSTNQLVVNPPSYTMASGINTPDLTGYGMIIRRHKIRGHGLVFQFTLSSVSGQPFDIMGWTIPELIDAGL